MDISKAKCPNCATQMDITRCVCETCDIQISGDFDLPELAKLTVEEQDFVIAFIQLHGSIKQVGEHFGMSYPTVKSKLAAIGEQLPVTATTQNENQNTNTSDILDQINDGALSVEAALQLLDG